MRSGLELLLEVNEGEDQMFELLYNCGKTMPRLDNNLQTLFKVTFSTLVNDFLTQERSKLIENSELLKAWTFLFIKIIENLTIGSGNPEDYDDQILVLLLKLIRLKLQIPQYKESLHFILTQVNRFIDLKRFNLSRTKDSITSIHILLEIYNVLEIPSIIQNLFFTVKNNKEGLICAK